MTPVSRAIGLEHENHVKFRFGGNSWDLTQIIWATFKFEKWDTEKNSWPPNPTKLRFKQRKLNDDPSVPDASNWRISAWEEIGPAWDILECLG